MAESEKRYSILKPIDTAFAFHIARQAAIFFGAGPQQRTEIDRILQKTSDPTKFVPYSAHDFIRFLESSKIIEDAGRYRSQIIKVVRKMDELGWLGFAGSHGFSFGGERHYHFGKELSKIQKTGVLWYTELLGLRWATAIAGIAVCQITGTNAAGDKCAGSGIILNSKHIITCRHVIDDMKTVDTTLATSTEMMTIGKIRKHPKIDLAVLSVDKVPQTPPDLVWDDADILDEIAILGFPRIPRSRESKLTFQRGEVCGSIQDLQGNYLSLFTAIARPGNSGGPAITARGTIAGIVTQELYLEDERDLPYFAMIPTNEIKKALAEIAPEVALPEDDFQ